METKEINNEYANSQTDEHTETNTPDQVARPESEAASNMLFGALWCIGGIIFTGVFQAIA